MASSWSRAGLDAVAEVGPAAAAVRAGGAPRAGEEAHEEGHFVPAPDENAAGEGGVGGGRGGQAAADVEAVEGRRPR